LRSKAKNLILTPLQQNSPEKNLYSYTNNKDRLAGLYYFPIHLPLMGQWTVTQAHDGDITHKGEWGKAFDFMIIDNKAKTYRNDGYQLSDYYCYNKPVFAPADGFIELIIDNIEDNKIGNVNTTNNWGNSIVIRHVTGLYSQISHLRKGTFKVAKGEFVKRGDLLAHCGNSGRSPEPHVHFQLQSMPNLGAKTIDYPFAYYFKQNDTNEVLMQFKKPVNGDIVTAVSSDAFLYKAFNLMPDNSLEMKYSENELPEKTENWDTYTDAYNQKYIYCAETDSTAYYVNDGFMFYFTAFYGNKKSLLYYFYLSAYKIYLGINSTIEVEDSLPLNLINKAKLAVWLHDFVAPFHNFMKVKFKSNILISENSLGAGYTKFASSINFNVNGKLSNTSNSVITITEKGITEFEYVSENTKIKAKCTSCQ